MSYPCLLFPYLFSVHIQVCRKKNIFGHNPVFPSCPNTEPWFLCAHLSFLWTQSPLSSLSLDLNLHLKLAIAPSHPIFPINANLTASLSSHPFPFRSLALSLSSPSLLGLIAKVFFSLPTHLSIYHSSWYHPTSTMHMRNECWPRNM